VRNVYAESCAPLPDGCAPSGSIRAKQGGFDVSGAVNDGGNQFGTSLAALLQQDKVTSPGGPRGAPQIPQPPVTLIPPGFCWHDDHAFLPLGAQAGIPCGVHVTGGSVDPAAVARALFDHLDLPDLRIGMNPRLGMVAVPTWFWVEGYGGEVIPLTDNLVVSHEECHDVANRDAGGAAVLDDNGAPATHRECRTISDTLTVQVRAWPRAFHWTFGDGQDQMVPCHDLETCSGGVGLAFTDPHVPSPIAHAYRWSSLGANGSADAYSIGLAITFGAQYRFSINGRSQSGWLGLDDRSLGWSVLHRVQEAQAVLTRPCPVSVVRC
jgi:hypothetical protein